MTMKGERTFRVELWESDSAFPCERLVLEREYYEEGTFELIAERTTSKNRETAQCEEVLEKVVLTTEQARWLHEQLGRALQIEERVDEALLENTHDVFYAFVKLLRSQHWSEDWEGWEVERKKRAQQSLDRLAREVEIVSAFLHDGQKLLKS